jgi:2-keto-3-deoxy-L-rhamnonate aldolase RhmA
MSVVRPNRTKEKLREDRHAVGAIIGAPCAEMVEVAALAGFDFITIDAEHEPLDDGEIVELIRSAEACDITPIVRVAYDADRLLRLLDASVQGLHIPQCSSLEDMRRVATSARFHPQGARTFYRLGRGGNFSRGLDDQEWARQANEQLLVIAMVEDARALAHLDDMLEVPGIDVIHIGPKDIWQSMGMPAAEEVEKVVARIAAAVRAHGRKLSLQLRAIDDIQPQIDRCVALGADMLSIPLTGLLLRQSEAFVAQVAVATT